MNAGNKAEAEFTILNTFGLHVRPATTIALMASKYEDTDIYLERGKTKVTAKVPLMILTIADVQGSVYKVSAVGPRAQEAVDEIVESSLKRFDVKGDE